MKAKILPSNEELKYLFDFDFENGIIYWKNPNPRANMLNKGDIAGNVRKNGYRYITLNLKGCSAHRIIYSVYHNVTLSCNDMIDHINGHRSDNRISNLRLCTNQENNRSRHTLSSNNSSGYTNIQSITKKSVNKDKEYHYWYVWITVSHNPAKHYKKHFNKEKYKIEQVVEHRDRKRKEFFGNYAGNII